MEAALKLGATMTCLTRCDPATPSVIFVERGVPALSVLPTTVKMEEETFVVAYDFEPCALDLKPESFIVIVSPGINASRMSPWCGSFQAKGSLGYVAYDRWRNNMEYRYCNPENNPKISFPNPEGWPKSPLVLTRVRVEVREMHRKAHAMEMKQAFDALPQNKNMQAVEVIASQIHGTSEDLRRLTESITRAFPNIDELVWLKKTKAVPLAFFSSMKCCKTVTFWQNLTTEMTNLLAESKALQHVEELEMPMHLEEGDSYSRLGLAVGKLVNACSNLKKLKLRGYSHSNDGCVLDFLNTVKNSQCLKCIDWMDMVPFGSYMTNFAHVRPQLLQLAESKHPIQFLFSGRFMFNNRSKAYVKKYQTLLSSEFENFALRLCTNSFYKNFSRELKIEIGGVSDPKLLLQHLAATKDAEEQLPGAFIDLNVTHCLLGNSPNIFAAMTKEHASISDDNAKPKSLTSLENAVKQNKPSKKRSLSKMRN